MSKAFDELLEGLAKGYEKWSKTNKGLVSGLFDSTVSKTLARKCRACKTDHMLFNNYATELKKHFNPNHPLNDLKAEETENYAKYNLKIFTKFVHSMTKETEEDFNKLVKSFELVLGKKNIDKILLLNIKLF